MMTAQEILSILLRIELTAQARRLQFINHDDTLQVGEDLMKKCVAALNELSIQKDELSRKQLVAITALLWEYRNPEWDGLKDYLILFLSRAGFGPSSIMLDEEYSRESCTYSFSHSLLNEVAIGVAHSGNEIMLGESRFLLTDFQKELWDELDSEENTLTGISAPTSAGKSYLILLKAMELLLSKRGTVVYVVPTLSLVNQVMGDFRRMLNRFGMQDYLVESGFNLAQHHDNTVYVFTQEKAIAAFNQAEVPFKKIRLLVIDEIQNIERVENEDNMRSKVLYDLMMELRNTATIDHIVVAGPRIVKIDEVSESIFGMDASKMETSSSPVLNLTYSVIKKKKKGFFLRVLSDLLELPLEVKITQDSIINGYGGMQYGEGYLNYLQEIVDGFEGECVLLFSPTSDICSRMASHLGKGFGYSDKEVLDDLGEYIADTVHPDYGLVEAVRKGITYHHGKLPAHVRPVIEQIIRDGDIKVIISTTSLLQGVNLPVQNIIIRNPKLYTRHYDGAVQLSKYDFANLRGRAGRLLKDFIGRTFILDESSFTDEEDPQLDLFKGADKELTVTYGNKYEKYKNDIREDILGKVGSILENKEYSHLTTYLRQTVLKYGINSQPILAQVGIQLSNDELNEIIESMQSLRVDKKVCARNRYWDPIDLDRLYADRDKFHLPTIGTRKHSNNAELLRDTILYMRENFPVYYDRFLKIPEVPGYDLLFSLAITADKWVMEMPMVDILSANYYDSTEKIEDGIEQLEETISYKLALLIKPVYDIALPDSSYPRFIEMGAYTPLTRALIELNIPRETALFLKTKLPAGETDRKNLVREIRRIRPTLNKFLQIQLSTI